MTFGEVDDRPRYEILAAIESGPATCLVKRDRLTRVLWLEIYRSGARLNEPLDTFPTDEIASVQDVLGKASDWLRSATGESRTAPAPSLSPSEVGHRMRDGRHDFHSIAAERRREFPHRFPIDALGVLQALVRAVRGMGECIENECAE